MRMLKLLVHIIFISPFITYDFKLLILISIPIELEKEMAQYSWLDGNSYVFMNNETFEEVRVPIDDVDNKAFLVEGQIVKLLKFRDNVIGILYIINHYINL